jgi:16S rRNA (uracil1498-N3)-methyltransferase
MELRHTPRLYIDAALSQGQSIEPSAEQAHYLLHVLRVKAGEVIRLFNGRDGEWRSSVSGLTKKSVMLAVQEQIRAPQTEPDLWLCAAPIKKAHFDYMIEKATELGVAVIQPILTARTQIREVNVERCRAIAIEAAEQSDRLTIPEIRKPVTLADMAAKWPEARRLIVCAEWGDASPIGQALPTATLFPAAIFTGPEGGLAADELEKLRALSQAIFVRLGPRILRADTAAIAALTCWQAMCGDWRAQQGAGLPA